MQKIRMLIISPYRLSIMPENPRLLSLGMNGIPERSQPLAGGVEANQA